ncbi:hypothetical protein BST61_g10102 [Cercospora zeina]
MDEAVIDLRTEQISFTLPATLLRPILAAESPDQVDSETAEELFWVLKTRLSKHQQDGSRTVRSAPHVIDLEAGASLEDAIEIESDNERIPAADTRDGSLGTDQPALRGPGDGHRVRMVEFHGIAGAGAGKEDRAFQDEHRLPRKHIIRSQKDEALEASKPSRHARKGARRRQARYDALGGMLLSKQALAGGAPSPQANGQWSQPEGMLPDEVHELSQHRALSPKLEPDSSASNLPCDSSGSLHGGIARASSEKVATDCELPVNNVPAYGDHVTDDLLKALGVEVW